MTIPRQYTIEHDAPAEVWARLYRAIEAETNERWNVRPPAEYTPWTQETPSPPTRGRLTVQDFLEWMRGAP